MIYNTLRLSLTFSFPFLLLSDCIFSQGTRHFWGWLPLALLWMFASQPMILYAVVHFTTISPFLAQVLHSGELVYGWTPCSRVSLAVILFLEDLGDDVQKFIIFNICDIIQILTGSLFITWRQYCTESEHGEIFRKGWVTIGENTCVILLKFLDLG